MINHDPDFIDRGTALLVVLVALIIVFGFFASQLGWM